MEAALGSYAEGVLKSAVGKLGTFLWNEALLWGSVRQDIQFIRDELQSMDGFLHDLISAMHLNNQMRVWMLHVLELACDAELCVDDFTLILGGHYRRGKRAAIQRFLRSFWTCWPRYQIAKTIQVFP
jgi:Rx N-terminal domain